MIRSLFALALVSACTFVPPAPPPDPAPAPTPAADGGAPTGDVYQAACDNERKLGCGVRDNCEEVFRHAVEVQITAVDETTATCISKARTKEDVRACGYADCP